ncbi:MAG: hypothetical protein M3P83_00360, partial [Actinomycetota bacterium]|nr:hypothetical protein [Actinomycetota bacterium]
RRRGAARLLALTGVPGERAPEWLLGPLDVRRSGPALVVSARRRLTADVAAMARRSVRQVRRVLSDWSGRFVIVVPPAAGGLERLLGVAPGTYDAIAAVTSSVDGTNDRTAPVRVVLNPPVFTSLGSTGAEVVLAHEATHVATGAATTGMPLWLIEGFADYVALAREPVPLEVAAGQVLRRVRRQGPPAALPIAADFSTGAHGLGAAYEAAWLACRLIAQEHGEAALLRFYRHAQRDGTVGPAFAAVLGTDERTFTRRWRRYLLELA